VIREQRLCDASVGTTVVVRSVDRGAAGQGRRLEDLGVIEGTLVRVERRAPMGDPTIYEVRHARLAMRRADAALVQVLSYVEEAGDEDDGAL
jgi:ferrous iron transport protein A